MQLHKTTVTKAPDYFELIDVHQISVHLYEYHFTHNIYYNEFRAIWEKINNIFHHVSSCSLNFWVSNVWLSSHYPPIILQEIVALFLFLVVPFNLLCYLKTHVEIFFHNAYQHVISSAVHFLTLCHRIPTSYLHNYKIPWMIPCMPDFNHSKCTRHPISIIWGVNCSSIGQLSSSLG